jgi:hypothetical protein
MSCAATDKFEKYVSIIPEEERGNLIDAYYKRLNSADDAVKFEAARHFVEWELSISKVRSPSLDLLPFKPLLFLFFLSLFL